MSIVPASALVVSVERAPGQHDTFALALDAAFLDTLTDDEIALRVVDRGVLAGVYEKVWERTSTRGTLAYLPVQ